MSRHTPRLPHLVTVSSIASLTVTFVAIESLAFVLTMTACTGGSDPILTDTPSPTVSTSPSTSPSPTTSPFPTTSLSPLTDGELLALMPPEAAYPDARGAIATAIFFIEQFPIVYETGDLRVWDALSMPECTFCESVRGHVREEASVGDFETGGLLTIDRNSIVANYFDVDGFTYVSFAYSQEPSTLHHTDGSSEPSGDGGTGTASLRMSLVGGVWHAVGIEVVSG